MQITTGQQLLQQASNGDGVTLNENGTLESQSKGKAFLQAITDFFASWTESGRTALAERNSRLHETLTTLLRNENFLINPAELQPDMNPVADPLPKAAMCAMQELSKSVRRFPESIRSDLSKRFFSIAQQAEQITNDPATTRANIRRLVNHYATNSVSANVLTCRTTPMTAAQLQATKETFIADMYRQYSEPNQLNNIKDGIHQSYYTDAPRHAIPSINGVAVNAENMKALMDNLVPDETVRGFVSMFVSQAGILGTISTQVFHNGLINGFSSHGDQIDVGMGVKFSDYTNTITSDDQNVYIDSRITFFSKATTYEDEMLNVHVPLAEAQITMRITVAKQQDLQAQGGIPQFSIPHFTLDFQ